MPTVAEPDPDDREPEEPRPKPLYVMGQNQDQAEPPGYRLYRPAWVVVYTAVANEPGYRGEDLLDACAEHFRLRYQGRVRDSDVIIDLDDPLAPRMARLKLRLPAMHGEFSDAVLAFEYAQQQSWTEFTVVEHDSDAERVLRAYGTAKLPPA